MSTTTIHEVSFIPVAEQIAQAQSTLNAALAREKYHLNGQATLGSAIARFAISSPSNANIVLKFLGHLDLTQDEKAALYPLLREFAELSGMQAPKLDS